MFTTFDPSAVPNGFAPAPVVPAFVVTVDAFTLKSALAAVKDAIMSSAVPVLRTVRLASDGAVVTVTATAIDITLSVKLDGATATVAGAVNVEHAMLTKMVADVKKSSANFATVTYDHGEANVTIGASGAFLPSHHTADWPRFPEFAVLGSLDVDVSTLIEVATASASESDCRPGITGVHIHNVVVGGGRPPVTSAMVATDSYRLNAVRDLPPVVGLDDDGLRISPAVVKVLGKAKAATATMEWSARQVRFVVGNLTVTAIRDNDSVFPNYAGIVPVPSNAGFKVDDTAEFAAGCKYLQRFRPAGNDTPVRVSGDASKLTLTMAIADVGTFTRTVRGFLVGDAPATIGFNPGYLQTMVADIDGPVLIHTIGDRKPAIIVADHPVAGERLRLIMPVRVG
jgi:DNA polymerase III sliding clamp (beta) subunit (PCNA family)